MLYLYARLKLKCDKTVPCSRFVSFLLGAEIESLNVLIFVVTTVANVEDVQLSAQMENL
jgi:hypothetical protein